MTDLATFERAVYSRAPNRVDLLAEILLELATGKVIESAAAGVSTMWRHNASDSPVEDRAMTRRTPDR